MDVYSSVSGVLASTNKELWVKTESHWVWVTAKYRVEYISRYEGNGEME
jgi:hypothetical protein